MNKMIPDPAWALRLLLHVDVVAMVSAGLVLSLAMFMIIQHQRQLMRRERSVAARTSSVFTDRRGRWGDDG